ncbi:MAG: N-acetylmuramoyl-L-alanine amidase [Saprospiraceae bacterium]|nr:N-acetylmuramoyl-L-alanine amidase [Bacteroidia bacterium]NNE13966.1 N-acetylmuramoyl-L-alanine amidase [Saprospiraceae bacterium]NNL92774.1 N-acetylmuramoyl-L-alanine amidase [Saprospiraceae bacterium]
MRFILSFTFLLLSLSIFAFEPYNFTVKAKKGDGIFSILRKYQLLEHNCSKARFLELNNLEITDHLIVGKSYKLPIKIYQYNGTSIRTTIGIENFKQALRIKDFNELILSKNLRKTKFTDSNILWVPYHELHCVNEETGKEKKAEFVTAVTPSKSKKGLFKNVELFGDKHKIVEIKDNSLRGEVYYLVSGHGGPDPGAMCTKECSNSHCEDEYAYDIVLRLARYLISHGATAHVIIQDQNDGIRDEPELDCDKDERCYGAKLPLSQKRRLRQRAEAINNLYLKHKRQGAKKQVAIMIHIDSYTDKTKQQDAYFYHHKTSKSSKKIAVSLRNTFKKKYNIYQKNRGYKGFVKTRNLYMLNNTLPTSVYVELANIQNSFDRKRLVIPSNREALAKWMYEGLTDVQI